MTILLALLLDVCCGDPPNRFHPVAWMGRWLHWMRGRAPATPRGQLLWGGGITLSGLAATFLLGRALERLCAMLPRPLGVLLEAAALKTTLALRGLSRAADEVAQALAQGDLARARHLVSWHLVSRDTRQLTTSQIAAAAIESVAENASDGLVAPLTAYALGGLPAALAYRYANTADAMLGYRDPAHEWLGKIPARVDDAFNLLPARLTAALIVIAARLVGEHSQTAWHTWRRDASKTSSPNAGHPMASMAGALQVHLEKTGHYHLGAGFPRPQATDIHRARRILHVVAILAAGLAVWARRRRAGP